MVAVASIVIGGIAVAALGIGILSFLLFRALQRHGDAAMVSFQLNPSETIREFRTLLYGHTAAAMAMGVLAVSAVTGNMLMRNVARGILVVYGFTAGIVFYQWWRRF